MNNNPYDINDFEYDNETTDEGNYQRYDTFENQNTVNQNGRRQGNKGNRNNQNTKKAAGNKNQKRTNSKQKQVYQGGNTGDKRWLLIGLLIVVIPAILFGFIFVTKTNKTGIVISGESVIEGLTISQLNDMELKVNNKSIKDISKDTIWLLNDNEIASGTNKINIDPAKLNWGINIYKAINGEDLVEYTVKLVKAIDTSDLLHNKMSLLADYDEAVYRTHSNYSEADETEIDAIVRQGNNVIDLKNGYIKTKQTYKNISLETIESKAYSLSMSEASWLDKGFRGDYSIEISGDFASVDEASITVNMNDEGADSVDVYLFGAEEIRMLASDEYYKYNGNIVINIKEPGSYIIKHNSIVGDTTVKELAAFYNVYIIKPSNVIKTETTAPAPETTPAPATTPAPVPEIETVPPEILGDGLDIGYYTTVVDKVLAEVTKLSDVKIKTSVATYENQIMNTYDGMVSATNYSGEAVKSKVNTLNEVINASINEQSAFEVYSSNSLIIVDLENGEYDTCKSVMEALQTATSNTNKNYQVLIISTKVNGLKSMAEFGENVRVYETDSSKIGESLVKQITAGISNGKHEETVNGSIDVIRTVADSGFTFGINNYNQPLTFNTELQVGDSYGQCLMTKMGYEKTFRKDMVTGKKVVYDTTVKLGDVEIPSIRVGAAVNSDTENLINSGNLCKTEEKEKIKIEDVKTTLTLAQLNSLNDNLMLPESFNYSGSYSYFIDTLAEKINSGKVVMATIQTELGYQTVLVTKISQSANDGRVFYIHMYDPTNPEEESVGKLTAYTGIENEATIGVGYKFEYTNKVATFNRLSLVGSIKVYSDDWVYNESFQ